MASAYDSIAGCIPRQLRIADILMRLEGELREVENELGDERIGAARFHLVDCAFRLVRQTAGLATAFERDAAVKERLMEDHEEPKPEPFEPERWEDVRRLVDLQLPKRDADEASPSLTGVLRDLPRTRVA